MWNFFSITNLTTLGQFLPISSVWFVSPIVRQLALLCCCHCLSSVVTGALFRSCCRATQLHELPPRCQLLHQALLRKVNLETLWWWYNRCLSYRPKKFRFEFQNNLVRNASLFSESIHRNLALFYLTHRHVFTICVV